MEDVLRIVVASPYSRMPVYEKHIDNTIGILHTKNVVVDFVQAGGVRSVRSLLQPIVRVRDEMPADRLLAFLREHRSHQALVLDENGQVAGLITLEDVVAELLGGVADEFKGPKRRAARPRDEGPRWPRS